MISLRAGHLFPFAVFIGSLTMGWSAEERKSPVQVQVLAPKNEIQGLKQKLESAGTAEAKHQLMEEYRSALERKMAQKQAARPKSNVKATREVAADLRERAGDDPKVRQQVEVTAARLAAIEGTKQKMEQIRTAEGEEKRRLLNEFRQEQQVLNQSRRQELNARQQQQKVEVISPSPETHAARAKAAERKREIEALKAAVRQAQPQERNELLGAFREKQEAEMTQRRRELETQRALHAQSKSP